MTISHSKTESFELFNAIANRYDFINSVLSLGLHAGWRRKIREQLPQKHPIKVLDLATGTADVALELVKNPRVQKVQGLDLSREMVKIGQQKVAGRKLDHRIELGIGDAQDISFGDCEFDAVTISFGIRNVPDVAKCLRECYRVLKPEGRLLILEFSLPPSRMMRGLHLFYLRRILPKIGRLLSGHQVAYQYLNETIEEFPHSEAFVSLMEQAGFDEASFKRLTFGIVNLYWGEKR
ncbi:MAG: bifunctional demethylmenaquinone methyltransferase/2-methoxy-6-polyprenyl-1,4-benzoquinol methylase UbiE [Oligoflexus sp.]